MDLHTLGDLGELGDLGDLDNMCDPGLIPTPPLLSKDGVTFITLVTWVTW